jgi:cation-transporting ATPase 13A1
MKERIAEMGDEALAIKGKHKSHVMYAGTTMLQAQSGEDSDYSLVPNPPDAGCVCFVLRTGFTSAQGKLVRMIEGSQEKVKGSEVETALLLLLLFFFACASSGYVLKKGWENKDRSKYEVRADGKSRLRYKDCAESWT